MRETLELGAPRRCLGRLYELLQFPSRAPERERRLLCQSLRKVEAACAAIAGLLFSRQSQLAGDYASSVIAVFWRRWPGSIWPRRLLDSDARPRFTSADHSARSLAASPWRNPSILIRAPKPTLQQDQRCPHLEPRSHLSAWRRTAFRVSSGTKRRRRFQLDFGAEGCGV